MNLTSASIQQSLATTNSSLFLIPLAPVVNNIVQETYLIIIYRNKLTIIKMQLSLLVQTILVASAAAVPATVQKRDLATIQGAIKTVSDSLSQLNTAIQVSSSPLPRYMISTNLPTLGRLRHRPQLPHDPPHSPDQWRISDQDSHHNHHRHRRPLPHRRPVPAADRHQPRHPGQHHH